MMLNSITNHKRLLLVLLCGSMSYSTLAKVYSWRDADGTMHYSQFPRQIVEKNAAQSRASRKQADMDDIVNDLSAMKTSNLLDGLDDIIANANVERQAEKVLTRRDPQLVLIEQQLARQLAKQQIQLIAVNTESMEQIEVLPGDVRTSAVLKVPPKTTAKPQNAFLAAIKKKLNRADEVEVIVASALLSKQSNAVSRRQPQAIAVPVQNKFLAEINKKLFRTAQESQVALKSELVQSGRATGRQSTRTTTTATTNTATTNKALMQSAEQIKAIESEISSSSQPRQVTAPSTKKINSALMLSRLSYNHNARLPLSGAGFDQLERQGIDASSQFVNEVNRSAE
ncbi:MAG: DUF4124 domain-containing protein [Moritella sp.]|uniref:DUF4124 domain-containing protein n=1 Tax=Moritella sp. TaxID=78556 RepID=UPI0029B49912|nr:DUF4124 domain-containing protein [Moritella sp.]MDX2320717.1 DUF4124 domain-containing protein [Moritella sp.]